MRLRINAILMAIITLAGCEEPKEIVPVAPPGFDLARVPTTPQGEGAQALGEQGGSTAATKQKTAPRITADNPPTPVGKPTKTASGLTYVTLVEGTGKSAKSGDQVEMHYTGTLDDGTKFDSSVGRAPLGVVLGMGQVIAGWDEGIPGMKVGEKRKLVIPSDLAYGPGGRDKIPPNATLTFEVELLSIK